MVTTPRPIIESVLQPMCGRGVESLIPLAGGGMSETYQVQLAGGDPDVVVRIARQGKPWFVDESHLMEQARAVGVPTAEVLGVEHVDHDGELLSFSVQRFLPGRSLADVVGELSVEDRERLVIDAGELLARVHSVAAGERGLRHELRSPDDDDVERITRFVAEVVDPEAAKVVERGVDFLSRAVAAAATPDFVLAQGDFMPKNLLVHSGRIVGVIDWEFAGAAPPAFDLARWEVSAGDPYDRRFDLLHRGYARIADPVAAAADLIPAYAIDWILELLAWRNPASPSQVRRCLEVMARYAL